MSASEIEVKAKELGWVPKDQFRGDPERWVDAEEFVRKGEELMPLLKATTKKQADRIAALEAKLAAATDSIAALTETTSKAAIKEIKDRQEELKVELKAAREADDVDAELAIKEKLDETREAIKAAEKPKEVAEPPKTVDYTQTPEWKEWIAENPWFGPDKRRTALALGIAQELRESGEKVVGKAFFDKVVAELNEMLGGGTRQAPSKVEGDARGSAEGGGKRASKTYNDLPADAKAACERQASRVVGEYRIFKTMADWRKHYTEKFFEE